jgi:hypothetical protein
MNEVIGTQRGRRDQIRRWVVDKSQQWGPHNAMSLTAWATTMIHTFTRCRIGHSTNDYLSSPPIA